MQRGKVGRPPTRVDDGGVAFGRLGGGEERVGLDRWLRVGRKGGFEWWRGWRDLLRFRLSRACAGTCGRCDRIGVGRRRQAAGRRAGARARSRAGLHRCRAGLHWHERTGRGRERPDARSRSGRRGGRRRIRGRRNGWRRLRWGRHRRGLRKRARHHQRREKKSAKKKHADLHLLKPDRPSARPDRLRPPQRLLSPAMVTKFAQRLSCGRRRPAGMDRRGQWLLGENVCPAQCEAGERHAGLSDERRSPSPQRPRSGLAPRREARPTLACPTGQLWPAGLVHRRPLPPLTRGPV